MPSINPKTAKLAYLMRYDRSLDDDGIREMIYDIYAGSFEEDFGAVDTVIDALCTALFRYRCATEDDDALDVDKEFIRDSREAEHFFNKCTIQILCANGWTKEYAIEHTCWPENLNESSIWEKRVLAELALIEAGHDLIVRDQLQRLWKEEEEKTKAAAASNAE